jgi:hypothetical protein
MIMDQNPWIDRARKGLIAAAVAAVEIANVWVGGPDWLYAVAAAAGAVLVYRVPNAPRFKDPRPGR